MNLTYLINRLKLLVKEPWKGLPEDLFLYVSSITPLVCVDLLIKDESNKVLLSWRDDKYASKGWHIPGSVVRHGEKLEFRLKEAAIREIGYDLYFEREPIMVSEFILKNRGERSHVIAFLYSCKVSNSFDIDNKDRKETDPGYLKWFDKCPDDLIKLHDIYRDIINKK